MSDETMSVLGPGPGFATAMAAGLAPVAVPDTPVYRDQRDPTRTADGSSRSMQMRLGRVFGRKGMTGAVAKAGRPRVLTAIGKAGRQNRTKKRRWPTEMVPPFDQAPPMVLGTGRRASQRAQGRPRRQMNGLRSHSGVASPHPVACSVGGSGESRGFRPR